MAAEELKENTALAGCGQTFSSFGLIREGFRR
jgi:hypothetical protein